MKIKNLFLILLLITCSIIFAQKEKKVWLIKGEHIGKGILYKPQDFINKELNFSNLILNAEKDSEVVAPASGTIKAFHYAYYKQLNVSMTFEEVKYNDSINISDYDIEFRKNKASQNDLNPNYISLLLGLETNKGEMYWIFGLRPTFYFKTGTKINKGDVIGKVGYSYHQIKEPSILFARDFKGKPADPMDIFGLKTTFKPPQNTTRNYLTYKHSKVKLLEDFITFREALEQGHPGLNDYISKKDLNELFDNVKAELTSSMTSEEFKIRLLPILKAIKDSHTGLISKRYNTTDGARPPILFGLKNDSIVVFSALPEYRNSVDKNIIAIDGEKIFNVVPKIKSLIYGNDGFITSLENRWMLLYFWQFYSRLTSKNTGDEITIQFSDKSEYSFKYQQSNLKDYYPKLEQESSNRFSVSTLSSQTALLDINTFSLLEKDIDSIASFIKKISDSSYDNLIIDVRDNSGGESKNIGRIFSYIAHKPFRVTQYQKVNSNTVYPFFKNSLNYPSDFVLFEEFESLKDKDGYYLTKKSFPQILPNKNIHFDKNVFVLTNELSRSAATVFPALIHQQKRGIIVGRETGSTYFQLNALKFAEIHLENTGLELRIPLVKVVFDEQGNGGIPWGRGVIPDKNIPLSNDELFSEEDPIINATLNIISNSENSDKQINKHSNYCYIFLGLLIVIIISALIFMYSKK